MTAPEFDAIRRRWAECERQRIELEFWWSLGPDQIGGADDEMVRTL